MQTIAHFYIDDEKYLCLVRPNFPRQTEQIKIRYSGSDGILREDIGEFLEMDLDKFEEFLNGRVVIV